MFNQGMIKAPTVGFYLDPNFWDSVAESSQYLYPLGNLINPCRILADGLAGELTLGVVTESWVSIPPVFHWRAFD